MQSHGADLSQVNSFRMETSLRAELIRHLHPELLKKEILLEMGGSKVRHQRSLSPLPPQPVAKPFLKAGNLADAEVGLAQFISHKYKAEEGKVVVVLLEHQLTWTQDQKTPQEVAATESHVSDGDCSHIQSRAQLFTGWKERSLSRQNQCQRVGSAELRSLTRPARPMVARMQKTAAKVEVPLEP